MKRMVQFTITLIIAVLVLASLAIADVPHMINYQGRLTDTDGKPVADSDYIVTFRIYDDSTFGAALLWDETDTVTTQQGLFSVILGRNDPILDSTFSEISTYLGIQLAGQEEMYHRTRLVAVSYAYHALGSDIADTAEYAFSAPPDNDWIVDTSGFNIFRMTGNVGIGTFPQYKLDVAGTAQMTGFKMPTGASNGYVLTSDVSGEGTWQIAPTGIGGSGTESYMPKFTNPTTLGNSNIYETGGNVGIGTTTPTEKLQVAGTIHSTSGGIKFPDGTLQVTAASGVGYHPLSPMDSLDNATVYISDDSTFQTIRTLTVPAYEAGDYIVVRFNLRAIAGIIQGAPGFSIENYVTPQANVLWNGQLKGGTISGPTAWAQTYDHNVNVLEMGGLTGTYAVQITDPNISAGGTVELKLRGKYYVVNASVLRGAVFNDSWEVWGQ
jgi:hypothetical protein